MAIPLSNWTSQLATAISVIILADNLTDYTTFGVRETTLYVCFNTMLTSDEFFVKAKLCGGYTIVNWTSQLATAISVIILADNLIDYTAFGVREVTLYACFNTMLISILAIAISVLF